MKNTGDQAEISVYNGITEKPNKPKRVRLTERLELFYNKPIDEIYVESAQEAAICEPVGKELW